MRPDVLQVCYCFFLPSLVLLLATLALAWLGEGAGRARGCRGGGVQTREGGREGGTIAEGRYVSRVLGSGAATLRCYRMKTVQHATYTYNYVDKPAPVIADDAWRVYCTFRVLGIVRRALVVVQLSILPKQQWSIAINVRY